MDFLPTKGIEYILVIAYLAVFVALWLTMRRVVFARTPVISDAASGARRLGWATWFEVPDGVFFHPKLYPSRLGLPVVEAIGAANGIEVVRKVRPDIGNVKDSQTVVDHFPWQEFSLSAGFQHPLDRIEPLFVFWYPFLHGELISHLPDGGDDCLRLVQPLP